MKQLLGISALALLAGATPAFAQVAPTLSPQAIDRCVLQKQCDDEGNDATDPAAAALPPADAIAADSDEKIVGPLKGEQAPFDLNGNRKPRGAPLATSNPARVANTNKRAPRRCVTGCGRQGQPRGLNLLITFEYGSDRLTAQGESNARVLAGRLSSPAYANTIVRIQGHTDSDGSDADNKALSERRANAVVAYLVAAGVPSANLIAEGYGEEQLLVGVPSNSPYNRRVEMRPAK